MKTVAIVTNGTLPVPPINGGAVENLIQTIIDINEKSNDFNLIIFSIKPQGIISNILYKNTSFYYINSKSIKYKIERIIRFILNKIPFVKVNNAFITNVLKHKSIFDNSDIIIVENNPYFIIPISKITNTRIGLHLHNDYLNKSNYIIANIILNNLSFVAAVSKYIKQQVSEISPKKCSVELVYNGIDIKRFNYIEKDNILYRQKYNIQQDEIVILFTGRLNQSKGIELLIDAFIELNDKYNIKLLVVGSSGFGGSKKNKFIKRLEYKSRQSNKIIFTGYVDYNDIHNIYRTADLAVFPSLTPEAFSLTTLEALASGLPVIVTDAGGMQEVINSRCGILLKRDKDIKDNLKKSIELLVNNPELRKKMSAEAIIRSSNFDDYEFYKSFTNVINKYI